MAKYPPTPQASRQHLHHLDVSMRCSFDSKLQEWNFTVYSRKPGRPVNCEAYCWDEGIPSMRSIETCLEQMEALMKRHLITCSGAQLDLGF
jgi:hypothetical protein